MKKEEAIIKCYSKLGEAAIALEQANEYLEEVKTDDFNDLWRHINELHFRLVDIKENIKLPEFGEELPDWSVDYPQLNETEYVKEVNGALIDKRLYSGGINYPL